MADEEDFNFYHSAVDDVPDGAVMLNRIEIIDYLDSDGERHVCYYAISMDNEGIDSTTFLGIMERTKLEAWQDDDED